MLGQVCLEISKSLLRSICPVEEFKIVGRDGARIDQCLEVNYAVPVVFPINHDADALSQLLGLRQG